jgi:tetratricopeptide (TPR) repeat protein
MAEPRRAEFSSSSGGPADRASQADALLVQGLDRYFAGQFDEAIHIWTRVLFLDRSHARARAYIDRARSALSERQRKSEEMLQAGQQLLEHGQTDEARHLLTEAVATAGDDERASALRVKLERVERARAVPGRTGLPISAAPDVLPAWAWPRRSGTTSILMALAAGVAVLLIVFSSANVRDWVGSAAAPEALSSPGPVSRLPVLSSSEVALIRARTLYGRGRLAQALQALDRIDQSSPARRDADALRVEIQKLLLASGDGGRGASGK